MSRTVKKKIASSVVMMLVISLTLYFALQISSLGWFSTNKSVTADNMQVSMIGVDTAELELHYYKMQRRVEEGVEFILVTREEAKLSPYDLLNDSVQYIMVKVSFSSFDKARGFVLNRMTADLPEGTVFIGANTGNEIGSHRNPLSSVMQLTTASLISEDSKNETVTVSLDSNVQTFAEIISDDNEKYGEIKTESIELHTEGAVDELYIVIAYDEKLLEYVIANDLAEVDQSAGVAYYSEDYIFNVTYSKQTS